MGGNVPNVGGKELPGLEIARKQGLLLYCGNLSLFFIINMLNVY